MSNEINKVNSLMGRMGMITEVMSIDDAYRKLYNNFINQDDYIKIIQVDPFTKNNNIGKIGQWLLTLMKRGEFNINELDNIKPYIHLYYKYRHKLSNKLKNLQNIKTVSEFYNLMGDYYNNPKQPKSKRDKLKNIKETGVKKLYEDNNWLLLMLLTKEASCIYGKNTKWCTASINDNENEFSKYLNRGPLIYVENKVNGRKYQYHRDKNTGEISMMNSEDLPIDFFALKLPNNIKDMLFNIKHGIIDGWEYKFYGFEAVRGDIINTALGIEYIYVRGIDSEYLIDDNGNEVNWEEVGIPQEIIHNNTNL